ncbi:MAG TPA: peptide chain release factor N(5)-glutamine methyltransferase, partial [Candidatus Tumulicola sp.]
PEQVERFVEWCAVRGSGAPLAYVLGTAGFYGRDFCVDPRVLVPRPETERLIAEALAFLEGFPPQSAAAVLDVGTGSGAIACTIAAEVRSAVVDGTDVSPEALEVAQRNARELGVAERCRFHLGDLAAPVGGRRFDVVLANLPYVPTAELPQRPDPVAFEPRQALDGGADGLGTYRRFVPAARALLEPGGLLLLEAAPPQMAGLLDLVEAAFPGLGAVAGDDFAGLARYVRVRIPGP